MSKKHRQTGTKNLCCGHEKNQIIFWTKSTLFFYICKKCKSFHIANTFGYTQSYEGITSVLEDVQYYSEVFYTKN